MNKIKSGLLVIIATLTFGTAFGQSIPPVSREPVGEFSGLPLDLLPPGARALGLGGAFTAVADDATAALANPAGLTNLTAPEVSIFLRYTDADIDFLDPDAFNSGLNYLGGDRTKTYSGSSTEVSFASFVVPFERVVLSGFYSNQLDFGSLQARPDEVADNERFLDLYTNVNAIESKVENYGLSLALRFTDRFSGGVTIRNTSLKLRSQDEWRVDWFADWERVMAEEFFGTEDPTLDQQTEFLPIINDIYSYETVVDDSEDDLAVDLGLYYKSDKWSFGLVYHDGADFKFDTLSSVSSEFSCNSAGGSEAMVAVCQSWVDWLEDRGGTEIWYPNEVSSTETTIKLPKVISFGAAWRPAETWLVSLDVNRIDYSVLNGPRNITLGMLDENGMPIDINDEIQRTQFYDPAILSIQGPVTEPIKDATTWHLGIEKSFVFDSKALRTLALRAGAFSVKDHDGVVETDNDETVWTLGLGSTWGKNELGAKVFQLDLGASFADDTTNIVLSGIMRF